MSRFKTAEAPLSRAREGALFVPEEFGSNEGRWDCRAVHSHECTFCAIRSLMNRPSDQFFSCAGFTQKQNGGIGGRHLRHLSEHFAKRIRRTDDVLEHRIPIYLLAQRKILVTCSFFHSDAFMNIGTGGIPANHLSLLIAERVVPNQEPAVLTIFSECAHFGFEWNSAFHRRLSLAAQSFQVVRMENPFPKVRSEHIFASAAGVIQGRLVGVYRRAGRVQNNDRLRYRIRDTAKLALIFAEFFLSLLQCLDVSARSIPSNDLSRFVAEWFHPNEEATKDSVVSAKSGFDLSCFS